jgi:hypothetical protein
MVVEVVELILLLAEVVAVGVAEVPQVVRQQDLLVQTAVFVQH